MIDCDGAGQPAAIPPRLSVGRLAHSRRRPEDASPRLFRHLVRAVVNAPAVARMRVPHRECGGKLVLQPVAPAAKPCATTNFSDESARLAGGFTFATLRKLRLSRACMSFSAPPASTPRRMPPVPERQRPAAPPPDQRDDTQMVRAPYAPMRKPPPYPTSPHRHSRRASP